MLGIILEKDIGYRAWKAEAWLGRHGILKTIIAEKFILSASKYNLNIDISTRREDTIFGDDWYKFLLNCRYVIGVEGGASIIDKDGSIRDKTNLYTQKNPDATFEQIESECFYGKDGSLSLFAISPRHLEACATRTCQILVEGEYNGVLEAGNDYISLNKDFSNLGEVLSDLSNEALRKNIVENAYLKVVESKKYEYKYFVNKIFSVVICNENKHFKNLIKYNILFKGYEIYIFIKLLVWVFIFKDMNQEYKNSIKKIFKG